ncbi:MAG: hypothetical protein WBH86_10080, partial [Thermogutta sp.]
TTCEIKVTWLAPNGVPEGYVPFAHFCDAEGEIVFQGRVSFIEGSSAEGEYQSVIRASLPDAIKPGTELELRVGLFRPGDGRRLLLSGPDDGQSRIRLGKLTVSADRSLSWVGLPDEIDQLMLRKNSEGREIDFGGVITAQGLRVTREDRGIRVMALPFEDRATTAKIIWKKLPWRLPPARRIEYRDLDGRVVETEAVSGDGSLVSISIVPPAVDCRIVTEQ